MDPVSGQHKIFLFDFFNVLLDIVKDFYCNFSEKQEQTVMILKTFNREVPFW